MDVTSRETVSIIGCSMLDIGTVAVLFTLDVPLVTLSGVCS